MEGGEDIIHVEEYGISKTQQLHRYKRLCALTAPKHDGIKLVLVSLTF